MPTGSTIKSIVVWGEGGEMVGHLAFRLLASSVSVNVKMLTNVNLLCINLATSVILRLRIGRIRFYGQRLRFPDRQGAAFH